MECKRNTPHLTIDHISKCCRFDINTHVDTLCTGRYVKELEYIHKTENNVALFHLDCVSVEKVG